MLRAVVLGLSLAATPATASDAEGASHDPAASDWHQHSLARYDGTQLHYSLARRPGVRPESLLLLLQGSGCNAAAANPRLHRFTAIAPDSAVLVVEKPGVRAAHGHDDNRPPEACPEAYFRHNTLHRRVLDALHVLAELRRAAGWWNGELTIAGGSSGAAVAAMLAPLVPETERLIVFSFGGVPLSESMQRLAEQEGSGLPPPELLAERFAEVREHPSSHRRFGGNTYAWWASALDMDPRVALERVRAPVLILHGTRDRHAPISTARDLRDALVQAGRCNVRYIEYESLSHTFKNPSGESRLDAVVADVGQWLTAPSGNICNNGKHY